GADVDAHGRRLSGRGNGDLRDRFGLLFLFSVAVCDFHGMPSLPVPGFDGARRRACRGEKCGPEVTIFDAGPSLAALPNRGSPLAAIFQVLVRKTIKLAV